MGVLAGRSLIAVALLLVVGILFAVMVVLVTAIRAASLTSEDAGRALYGNLWVFSFVASAGIAAFTGYCLGVLLTGGF
jgi:hypothetical protein